MGKTLWKSQNVSLNGFFRRKHHLVPAVLDEAGLLSKYPNLPQSIQTGFLLKLPKITETQTPPNTTTIIGLSNQFNNIINLKITKQRYLGPITRDDMESLIGPFQSSPFSIIPKPGRPDNFCILQNYSFPHNILNAFPNPSINSSINSDNFPTTWGTFTVISLLIHQLLPNSQVGTRDVTEAYQTIPLHHSQWPRAVARIRDDAFCIDMSTCFGVSPSLGVYGSLTDAGTDLFCSHGIGPLAKWVDDHIFFRILLKYLPKYNCQCAKRYTNLAAQGRTKTGWWQTLVL